MLRLKGTNVYKFSHVENGRLSDFLYLFIASVEGYYFVWSHSTTHTHTHTHTQSVGLLWTRDRAVAEVSLPDNTQHSEETDIDASGGIRTRNPSKRAAADLRFRLRGDRDMRQNPHATNENRKLWIQVLIILNADTACCWLDLHQSNLFHDAFLTVH